MDMWVAHRDREERLRGHEGSCFALTIVIICIVAEQTASTSRVSTRHALVLGAYCCELDADAARPLDDFRKKTQWTGAESAINRSATHDGPGESTTAPATTQTERSMAVIGVTGYLLHHTRAVTRLLVFTTDRGSKPKMANRQSSTRWRTMAQGMGGACWVACTACT